MTRLQLDYAQYLENRRHSMEMEGISKQELAETIKSHRNAEANAARSTANAERATTSQIKAAEAAIALQQKEFNLKKNQTNWQQQLDKFNLNIKQNEQMIKKDQLALDQDKFNQGQANWWKEYELKQGNYNLAVQQFKANKTSQTWNNVLATSKELRAWINPASKGIAKAAAAIIKRVAK